jgi:TolB-like protein/Tfp pilus assembly protein PilF
MKRCPACKRIENDDTLVFCRADGTILISDSGSVSADAGTARFGSSPVASEVETSVLLPQAADADINRSTGPTTVLDRPQTISRTRELSRPKRTKALAFTVAVFFTAAIVFSAYFYFSGKNTAAIQSIAVLPFVNESGNADVEYLSDGMTESLISSLSQIPKLNVKARSSVFRYKGKDTNVQTIGKELNVEAILNGRVVQHGQDLILYVELVDAATENVLWKQTYNKTMTNLVALQNNIARDVADKLKVKLTGADEQKLTKKYTENPEAYQLYLKGRFYWNKRTPQDIQKSIEYFDQAITLDPNYALAHTGLADAYALLPVYSNLPAGESLPKAREAALKALSLDDRLAEAHTALGDVLNYYDYDFAGAEREYKRAIELNPNYATAHQWYGELLTHLGRHEESLAEMRRALQIDPLSLIINRAYGESYLFARRYDEAIAQLRKTIELEPNFATAHDTLGSAYQIKGDYADGVAEFVKARELYGKPEIAALARESFARGGYQEFLRAMTGERRPADLQSHFVAKYLVMLGEKDKALAELNRSFEKREYYLVYLNVDPRFDLLRDDPRFAALVRRVGLPQ